MHPSFSFLPLSNSYTSFVCHISFLSQKTERRGGLLKGWRRVEGWRTLARAAMLAFTALRSFFRSFSFLFNYSLPSLSIKILSFFFVFFLPPSSPIHTRTRTHTLLVLIYISCSIHREAETLSSIISNIRERSARSIRVHSPS